MLKRLIFWPVFLLSLGGGLWLFETARLPCREPLAYSIGTFDQRFGITKAEFLAAVAAAERVWESASQRDLFAYDPQATFHINLIYDERQERTQAGHELKATLTTNEKERQGIEASYQTLHQRYLARQAEYEAATVAFEKALAAYNTSVADWNNSDRTNEAEFKQLRQQEERLRDMQQAVEGKRRALNALVPQVNALVRSDEQKVKEYNAQVSDFTERYGQGGEFDQGLYQGQSIDIYQFDDEVHLRAVLAHELGHALGIGHVTNIKSLMFPLLKDQTLDPLVLSSEDKAAINAVCSVTTEELLRRDIHAWLTFWYQKLSGIDPSLES